MTVEITKTTPFWQKHFKIEVGEKYKVERYDYLEDKDGNRHCYLIYTKNGRALTMYKNEVKVIE